MQPVQAHPASARRRALLGALSSAGIALSSLATTGCASELRRFPLRDPVWVDGDLQPVSVACRPDPEDPKGKLCRPEEYVSPFLWDVADKSLFRPVGRFFAADMGFEAKNVNAVDEVPDSSWFTNRIGAHPFTDEEISVGSCGKSPIGSAPKTPGAWLVDLGKANGANPGFRVNIEGVGKFMLKADAEGEGEKATGATAIASRIYHAAGWWTVCDTVIYVDPAWLKLKPGLEYADNSGVKRPFDDAKLASVLGNAQHRDGLVRMVASRWLSGRAIGPFRYEEVRSDDPNDVIPHEDRRDLRGARVIAAWLAHFDSREQNTMTTWEAVDTKAKDSSPGYTKHWYIDLGDCFGSHWEWESWNRRLNHSYYFDLGDIAVDLVTLGALTRPWDHPVKNPELPMFDYYRPDFDPDDWKGGYPNPAFSRMTEQDAAWAARIVARFTDANLAAAVKVGDYTDPRASAFLTKTLIARRDAIVRRYLSKLSPLADVTVQGDEVCAVDLARKLHALPPDAEEGATFAYAARLRTGAKLENVAAPAVRVEADGKVCVPLPRATTDASLPKDAPLRYAVLDVTNGVARGPLRLHFYDLGPEAGYRLVGAQRPADLDESIQ